jgi:hypothetical protein
MIVSLPHNNADTIFVIHVLELLNAMLQKPLNSTPLLSTENLLCNKSLNIELENSCFQFVHKCCYCIDYWMI